MHSPQCKVFSQKMSYSSNKSSQTTRKEDVYNITNTKWLLDYATSNFRYYLAYGFFYMDYCYLLGSIFLRKKIDTQKEVSHESSNSCGRYGDNYGDDNFFIFSPPDFTLVSDVHFL